MFFCQNVAVCLLCGFTVRTVTAVFGIKQCGSLQVEGENTYKAGFVWKVIQLIYRGGVWRAGREEDGFPCDSYSNVISNHQLLAKK